MARKTSKPISAAEQGRRGAKESHAPAFEFLASIEGKFRALRRVLKGQGHDHFFRAIGADCAALERELRRLRDEAAREARGELLRDRHTQKGAPDGDGIEGQGA